MMAQSWHNGADDNRNPAWYNIDASGENLNSVIFRLLRKALSSALRRGCENAKEVNTAVFYQYRQEFETKTRTCEGILNA